MSAWTNRIPAEDSAAVLRAAIAQGVVTEDDPWVAFHDLGLLRARVAELVGVFPASALHAVAIKANPLVEVLKVVVAAGAGLEAASIEEVHLALAAGCQPDRIVFDSPAKTRAELKQALNLGVSLNADNREELQRIEALGGPTGTTARIGLRVNPLVGEGAIGMTSVAGVDSKFGEPLRDQERVALLNCYERYPWLNSLHVHVGSQGCEPTLLVRAVQAAFEFRNDVHRYLDRSQIRHVDIGGGLPTAYEAGATAPAIAEYARAIAEAVPAAFASDVSLITEFGRSIQAGCGWAASRVEYVKPVGNRRVAVVHMGADFLMRPVYQPDDWTHPFAVLDAHAWPKQGDESVWSLAGPLCFGGDIIARDRTLPAINTDDWVVASDTGAYTFGLWSRHCSRGMPPVLGYENTARAESGFRVLRRRESPADMAKFWSAEPF